jgi:hypothetical protein
LAHFSRVRQATAGEEKKGNQQVRTVAYWLGYRHRANRVAQLVTSLRVPSISLFRGSLVRLGDSPPRKSGKNAPKWFLLEAGFCPVSLTDPLTLVVIRGLMFKLVATVALAAAALLASPTIASADKIPFGKYDLDGSEKGIKPPSYTPPPSVGSPAPLDICSIIDQIISQSDGEVVDPVSLWLHLMDHGVASPSDLQIYLPFMMDCLYRDPGNIAKPGFGATYRK